MSGTDTLNVNLIDLSSVVLSRVDGSVVFVAPRKGTPSPVHCKRMKDLLSSRNAIDLIGTLAYNVNAKLIFKVGHKISHQFKPWKAVRLSSKFAKAVPSQLP